MRDVLKNLVDGLSVQWTRLSQYWKVPNSASLSEARQRLGCQVMQQLFEQVVCPLASPQTPGAFLGGLRLMAVDGTLLDVPDSQANARVFGYPGTRFGNHAAFPKVRLVLLIEPALANLKIQWEIATRLTKLCLDPRQTWAVQAHR